MEVKEDVKPTPVVLNIEPEDVKTEEPVPEPVKQTPVNDKQALLSQAGVAPSDWHIAEYIFFKESSWIPDNVNSGGCMGLGQSCPGGSNLLADCPNWQNDPVCQIKHFAKYAANRYGGWQGAHNFWLQNNWW